MLNIDISTEMMLSVLNSHGYLSRGIRKEKAFWKRTKEIRKQKEKRHRKIKKIKTKKLKTKQDSEKDRWTSWAR